MQTLKTNRVICLKGGVKMKKTQTVITKKIAKGASQFIQSISDVIVGMPSGGNYHEPKMPESMKK